MLILGRIIVTEIFTKLLFLMPKVIINNVMRLDIFIIYGSETE